MFFSCCLISNRIFHMHTRAHACACMLRDPTVRRGSAETAGIRTFSLTRLILRNRQLDLNFQFVF